MIISNEQELKAMREIGRICAITLRELGEVLKPGITTLELDELAKKLFSEQGARSAPISCYQFPGHTCISVNEEVAHGIPGSRVLKEGDKVNIDVSAHKNGYFADTSATFVIGAISHHRQKLIDCCKRCLDRAISASVAGNPLNKIGLVIEKEAKRNGFRTIKNLCGHGVGHTLHDEPESIFNYFEKRDHRILRPGMVLAIEPFISDRDEYVEEEPDGWTLKTPHHSEVIQFEHTVMVGEDEPIILTLP